METLTVVVGEARFESGSARVAHGGGTLLVGLALAAADGSGDDAEAVGGFALAEA